DSENGVEIVTKTSSGEKRFNPTELTAILFKQLREITSEFQQAYNNGEEIKEAVITVPSFYDNIQREAIKEAAESAGIKVLDLLEEPIAGALYYIANKRQVLNSTPLQNQNILIFDLSGGTLDISVLQVKDGKLNEIGRSGEPYLGGRNFDAVLADHISTIMENKYKVLIKTNKQKHKLMSMAESLKIDLTVAEQSTFDVTEFSDDVSELIEITREKFENLSKGLIHRINFKVKDALHQSGTENINQVVYIGGSCKMPMIKRTIKQMFSNIEHYHEESLEYGIAIGACIHALQLYQGTD
ncbi:hypothetical protein FO519_010173, partial [Halicephalobus sp. NKZ332]